jgi:hypothetical protein
VWTITVEETSVDEGVVTGEEAPNCIRDLMGASRPTALLARVDSTPSFGARQES